jgi:primosomal replication protein N
MENNKVALIGYITEQPVKTFTTKLGITYYSTNLEISRNSGTVDNIPVIFNENKLQAFTDTFEQECLISIKGYYKSRNESVNGKHKLSLSVFAEYAELTDLEQQVNDIKLTGFIVKTPVYRETPFHRCICDLLVAVNRDAKGKSDYIPCIAWGENAKALKDSPVGTKITLTGRIQSRLYEKEIDGKVETRVAYEVSVIKITKEN